MTQAELKKLAQILYSESKDDQIRMCDLCHYYNDGCNGKCVNGISRGLKDRMNEQK